MKNKIYLLLLLPLLIVGCKSNEEKAEELIKTELSKTLYDFESYSPVETTVTKAKHSVYTDTNYYKMTVKVNATFDLFTKSVVEAADLVEKMSIYGPPSYYSSSYSDYQYYKYKKEGKEKIKEAQKYLDLVKEYSKNLKDSLKTIDTTKIVGWEVTHRFRCKTKGGLPTFGNFRYVIDKDFKKIILEEDMDDESYEKIRETVKFVINGDIDTVNLMKLD
jgi:hypothetical protein